MKKQHRYCFETKNKVGRWSYRGKQLFFIDNDYGFNFVNDLEHLGYIDKRSILKYFEKIKDSELKDDLLVNLLCFQLEPYGNEGTRALIVETIKLRG